MKMLNDLFLGALSLLPYEFAAKMVVDKLENKGLKLRTKEKQKLVKHLQTGTMESFRIIRWPWWQDEVLKVEFTEEDCIRLEKEFNNFEENLFCDMYPNIVDEIANIILNELNKNWASEANYQRRCQDKFDGFQTKKWGAAVEKMQMLLTIAGEFGESSTERLLNDINFKPYALIDVMGRLHARACQITCEIICLISSGFADGAIARWRTLHEISVVAFLISKHGEDLSVRYREHNVVESYRAAAKYQECYQKLGYEPLSEKENMDLEKSYKTMLVKYGQSFGKPYGWAAEVLGNPNPKFFHLEEAAGLNHLRSHYKLASFNVHANPKGVYFKLGLLEESNILLAGPSSMGMADPGHLTAISLTQITTALGLINPNFDSLVVLKLMLDIEREIGHMLISAEKNETENTGEEWLR